MARKSTMPLSGTSKLRQEFPGVTVYKDRHGKVRWRCRIGASTVNLGTDYGSPEFLRRYSAAMKGERLPQAETTGRTSQAPPGSLSRVIDSWYVSPEFKRLSALTSKQYQYITEHLREAHGERPIQGLTRPVVKKLIAEKADRPSAANSLLRILRFLLDHAVELGMIENNPARVVKKYSPKNPDGYHTWTEEEIENFFGWHEEGTIADLAMALMLYTGAARSDAVQMGPGNIVGGRIQYRRQKMKGRQGVLVDIPMHPDLKRRLDKLPDGQATFLQTAQGKERTAAGLGTAMRDWANAAGLEECSSHGLRKACARRLAEAGATPHEIMAVTGHSTLKEVERYTSKVTRAGLADRAMQMMQRDHEDDAST